MKTLFFTITLIALMSFNLSNTNHKGYTDNHLTTFDSALVIHLYNGGGMYYGSLDIYIRHDSCIRVDMDHGLERTTKFAMTEDLRKEVIGILKTTNAYTIKEDTKAGFAHDKATSEICITHKNESKWCVSSGASSEIAKKSKADFYMLWDWIEKFSLIKK